MKCQLGVMEEPKENADKVSWTAYGASHYPLRWESRHKEDAELKLSTIKQISNRYDASYFLYALGSSVGRATHCNAYVEGSNPFRGRH